MSSKLPKERFILSESESPFASIVLWLFYFQCETPETITSNVFILFQVGSPLECFVVSHQPPLGEVGILPLTVLQTPLSQ